MSSARTGSRRLFDFEKEPERNGSVFGKMSEASSSLVKLGGEGRAPSEVLWRFLRRRDPRSPDVMLQVEAKESPSEKDTSSERRLRERGKAAGGMLGLGKTAGFGAVASFDATRAGSEDIRVDLRAGERPGILFRVIWLAGGAVFSLLLVRSLEVEGFGGGFGGLNGARFGG